MLHYFYNTWRVIMRKIASMLAFAALMVLNASAQTAEPRTANTDRVSLPMSQLDISTAEVETGKGETPQALSYTTLFRSDNGLFTYVYGSTPMVYEPKTGVLALAYNQRQDANQQIGVQLQIRTSTNSGKNWTAYSIVHSSTNEYIGMPQIGVMNPDGATDVSGLYFIVTGRSFRASNNYQVDGTRAFLKFGEEEAFEATGFGKPKTGSGNVNPSNYNFDGGYMASFIADGAGAIAFAGNAGRPANSSAQYGPYAFWLFSGEGDFAAESMPWDDAMFRQAPTVNNTFNGPMDLGFDADGKVYAAVNNIFAEEENSRIPAVSMSANNGKTWGDFNKMPSSLITQYGQSVGAASATVLDAYAQNAFVVTAPNQYSFFFRVGLINDVNGQNQITSADIVEAEYKNDTWAMRKVSTINDLPWTLVYNNDSSTAAGKAMAIRDVNNQGNELQVARTADGNNLVLKWIDYNTNRLLRFANTELIQVSGTTTERQFVDSAYMTDVYISHRLLNEDGWNPAKNVTDDDFYDKGTKIPSIVPSLSSIPLLVNHSVPNTAFQATSVLRNYPNQLLQQMTNIGQDVKSAAVDLLLSSVENPSASFNPNFSLSAARPNPAAEEAEVAFVLNEGGLAKLELFDAMGRSVKVIYEGVLAPSVAHAQIFSTSNLSSGVYYYTLTVGGQSLTKSVSVVR